MQGSTAGPYVADPSPLWQDEEEVVEPLLAKLRGVGLLRQNDEGGWEPRWAVTDGQDLYEAISIHIRSYYLITTIASFLGKTML